MAGLLRDNDFSDLLVTKPKNSSQSIEIEALPQSINGVYTTDYNILHIDNLIRKILKQEKYTELPNLIVKSQEYSYLVNQSQTYVARVKTLELLEDTLQKINMINSGEKIRKYEESVKHILENYKKLRVNTKEIVFGEEDEITTNSLNADEQTIQRINLIEDFVKIANNYITINLSRVNKIPHNICLSCGETLSDLKITETGSKICVCGAEYSNIIFNKNIKETNKILPNTSGNDDSLENFLRAFDSYCGNSRSKKHFPEEFLQALDEYFTNFKIPTRFEAGNLPKDHRGHKSGTSHKIMLGALEKIPHANYYADIELLCHIYWGWDLPNVAHLRHKMVSIYNKTQLVFNSIPLSERKRNSSLGTQFRLFKQLQLCGHECYEHEFLIADNEESYKLHHKLWKRMCDEAADPDIYYIA